MNQQHFDRKTLLRMLNIPFRIYLFLFGFLLLLAAILVLPVGKSASAQSSSPTTTNDIPLVTPTKSQMQDYTISGTVRDHQGAPVANVLVDATTSGVVMASDGQNTRAQTPYHITEVIREGESNDQLVVLSDANSTPQSASVIAFTDAQGRYTLTVSANTYQIKVSRLGYFAPPAQTVTVPPSRTDVDFTFLTPYTIAGFVRDGDGNPVVNADVTRLTDVFDFDSVTTDASGHYSFAVGTSEQRINVSKAGYLKVAEQTVTVPPSRSDVNFSLQKCATGTGTTPAPCSHWAGTTDAGRAIVFDVLADGTTWTNFKLSTTATAGFCSLTITTTLLTPGSISDSHFGKQGGSFSFSGQFTDPNTASGDYQYNDNIFGCGFLNKSGTWTANGTFPAPIITVQPLNQTIPQGANATISVTAMGSPPLRYQWYQGNPGDTNTPLMTATLPTYTAFSLVNSANFWVRVTNAQGLSTDSSTAEITVSMPPTPTDTPPHTPTSTPTNISTNTPISTPTPPQNNGTPSASHHAFLPVVKNDPTPTPTATSIPTATSVPTTQPTTPPPTPGTPGVANYAGVWKGTTSQGKEISFRVQDHGFAFMSVDFFFSLTGCSTSGPTSFWTAQPIKFTGNTFSVSVSRNTTVAGTFDSNTAASGKLDVVVREPFCVGSGSATWTATKSSLDQEMSQMRVQSISGSSSVEEQLIIHPTGDTSLESTR